MTVVWNVVSERLPGLKADAVAALERLADTQSRNRHDQGRLGPPGGESLRRVVAWPINDHMAGQVKDNAIGSIGRRNR